MSEVRELGKGRFFKNFTRMTTTVLILLVVIVSGHKGSVVIKKQDAGM